MAGCYQTTVDNDEDHQGDGTSKNGVTVTVHRLKQFDSLNTETWRTTIDVITELDGRHGLWAYTRRSFLNSGCFTLSQRAFCLGG